MGKTIILFDIDRTLIDILPIQVEAFYNVFWRKYKVKTTLTDVEYAEMPFKKVVEDLIRYSGLFRRGGDRRSFFSNA